MEVYRQKKALPEQKVRGIRKNLERKDAGDISRLCRVSGHNRAMLSK